MILLLPQTLRRRIEDELRRAGHREIGGLLMGECIDLETYRIVDISVQRNGGNAVCFVRDPKKHQAQLDDFFDRTGANYRRFNYLGEWHSHPNFAVKPSGTDVDTMEALVGDSAVGANFLTLMIVRLDREESLELGVTVFYPGQASVAATIEGEKEDINPTRPRNAFCGIAEAARRACRGWLVRWPMGQTDVQRISIMMNRFEGEAGKRLRVEALSRQKLIGGNAALAVEVDVKGKLLLVMPGEVIIEQGGSDNDVYLILSGAFDIVVNGRIVQRRHPTDHVGEMAAVEPTQRRSATVIAVEESVVVKLTEPDFSDIGNRYPEMYRGIAKELARRLLQRNALVSQTHDKIRVFIISSAEALGVARSIQNALAHDPFTTTVWTDGVFRATQYTLQSLEDQVDCSDFAIAVAHADDVTDSKGASWPSPRDNVIFELGLFMGRLGKSRAILMEPRGEGVKLPSDLAGVTAIPYRYEKGPDSSARMAPACNELREYISRLGPNN